MGEQGQNVEWMVLLRVPLSSVPAPSALLTHLKMNAHSINLLILDPNAPNIVISKDESYEGRTMSVIQWLLMWRQFGLFPDREIKLFPIYAVTSEQCLGIWRCHEKCIVLCHMPRAYVPD
jgi:hypothetical protein